MNAADRLRTLCLALPEAYEQPSHGTASFRVGKRVFAWFADGDNHHGNGRHGAWLNAPPGVQRYLVETEPEKYYVPPYVGVRGWIGVYLDTADDEELRSHLIESYLMVAPRRLAAAVSES